MVARRLTIKNLPGEIKDLPGHVRRFGEQFLLDLKTIFLPGQAPAPLVLAVALGTLLSFIPAPFLDSLLVGVILARYKQVNRPAVLVARMVWNDLIVVPLYVPGFRLGVRFLQLLIGDNGAPHRQIIGFALGILALAAAATITSAVFMFTVMMLSRQWQRAR